MTAKTSAQAYEFGPYRIDTAERLLRRGEELISLPPKAVDTLLVLVINAGRMVEKGELIQAVWTDTFVEEGALTRNVSMLRKALGEAGEDSAYIETIPKRGYRFIAPVRLAALQSAISNPPKQSESAVSAANNSVETGSESLISAAAGKWVAPAAVLLLVALVSLATYMLRARKPGPVPAVGTPANTLAVLPFRSVDSDASDDYFADGMTQALITGLTKLGNLRVVNLSTEPGGRMDPVTLDRIVRSSDVKRMLTGTVLRSGGRVRIDAQLIDPSTRAVYWANNYERDLKDVLSLESAVAQAIATEIQVTISADEQQRLQPKRQINPETLDAYLRGRYFWNRRTEESVKHAVQYFQQAITSDPTYAPAYSGLADSYSLLGSVGLDGMAPNTAMPLAKAAAQKAIELDPKLDEGHASLAYVLLSYDWDLRKASEEFNRALALNPASATAHHWHSHYFMAAGDLGKASVEMQEALRLEPLSPSINIGIGWCYYYTKQYDKAIEQYRSVVEMYPDFPLAHQTLGMAYQQAKKYPDAIEEFQRAASLSANSPTTVAGLATAYAAAGKIEEARKELARLEEMSQHRYVPALYFANIHNSLGDVTGTLGWGWKAVGERSDYLMYLRVEPLVGKIAGNPEFIRLLGSLQR